MNNSPLICDMGVFTTDQREAHILNTTQLMQAVQNIQEVENGFEFTFANEDELIVKLAEFVTYERLCCHFLKFTLIVNAKEAVSLALTGPLGTQEFLREEFSGAFQ